MTDNELFWQLLEKEYERAHMFCRKLMNHREKGDDLCQDALVVALSKFDQLRDHTSFMPWLYQIILNRIKSSYRKNKIRSYIPFTPEIAEQVPVNDTSGQINARYKLNRLFNSLTSDERSLVILYELEGWPLEELSRLFNQTENNLRVRLSRARQKMRQALKQITDRQFAYNDLIKEIGELYAL